MENQKLNNFLNILAIFIVVVAIAIIISYSIEYSKLSKLKKSYSELEIKYEEVLEKLELYENNKTKEDSNKLEVDNTTSNINLGNLDINSELVQNLYSKILKCNKTAIDYEGSFYKDEKTTINNLNNKEKNITIIQNLTEKANINFKDLNKEIQEKIIERLEKHYRRDINLTEGSEYVRNLKIYSEEELKEKTTEIFGNNTKINFENLNSGMDSYWEYIDGNYYSFSGYGGGGYGAPNDAFGKIQYAIEEKEYIYIYDKFIYLRDYPSEDIYSNGYKNSVKSDQNNIGIISKFLNHNSYEEYQNSLNKLINILYDKLYMYKHTFKKAENGEYYWISTEKYVE